MGTHLEAAANAAQASPAILPFALNSVIAPIDTGMIAPGICATGTVETAKGAVSLGDLRAGDQVATRDNGLQPLLWVGRLDIPADELALKPWLCPVTITPHALKPDHPECELMLSQQALVMVRSRIVQRMVGAPEVLVPASQLCQIDGIRIAQEPLDIRYVTLLFASHQIVAVNGIETGSLYLDAMTASNLPEAIRGELAGIVATSPRPVSARMILDGRMGRRLADRHRRNDKRLIA